MTKQEIMIRIKEVLILVNEKNLNVSRACKSVAITASTFYRNVCYDEDARKFILIGESYKVESAIKFLKEASMKISDNDNSYIRYCIVEALKCLTEIKK